MDITDLLLPPQEMKELSILEELGKNPVVSQRELSNRLGFALGATNASLKRMVRKGWIQIKESNHYKVGYYLTPRGFAEKTRLTSDLISWRVGHYSYLKESIRTRLIEMRQAGVERFAFYGVGDTMEIAYLMLQKLGLKLVGIVEDEEKMVSEKQFGYELMRVGLVRTLDAEGVFITSLTDCKERMERIKPFIAGTTMKVASIYET